MGITQCSVSGGFFKINLSNEVIVVSDRGNFGNSVLFVRSLDSSKDSRKLVNNGS